MIRPGRVNGSRCKPFLDFISSGEPSLPFVQVMPLVHIERHPPLAG
jgi:hypothetical protein